MSYNLQAKQMNSIWLKILYKNQSQLVLISQQNTNNGKGGGTNKISFGRMLDQANKFRKIYKISNFLDIFIKQKKDEWFNIYEIVGNSQTYKFQPELENYKQVITIKLVEHDQKEYDYLSQCNQKIEQVSKKVQKIDVKVQQDVQKIEEDYTVDLAFFYAEPVMTYLDNRKIMVNKNDLKTTSEQVSFLLEIKKIFQTLNLIEGGPQQQLRTNPIRSAKIEIQVGTSENIKRALSKGVKIMHFSCHGTQDHKLELEIGQREIGVAEYVDSKALENILLSHQTKIPEIIVFNACYSQQLASQIHQLKINGIKNNITTIGFKDKIDDWFCQKFSADLYSVIFNGENVQQFFEDVISQRYSTRMEKFYSQKYRNGSIINNEKDLQEKVKKQVIKQLNKILIFYKKQRKLKLKPSLVNQFNPLIQVKNKLQTTTINFSFLQPQYKQVFYESMKKILYQKKKVMGVFGAKNLGKTYFVKKLLEYLWQRGLINQYLQINLKSPQHTIDTTLQLQCKLQKELEDVNFLKINKGKYCLFSIDHCDRIIKYQQKQFQNILNKYENKLQSKGLKIKFVYISCKNKNNFCYSQDLYLFNIATQKQQRIKKKVQLYKNKNKSQNKQIKYKIQKQQQNLLENELFQSQSSQFIVNCSTFLANEIPKLRFDFIKQIPIISIFPQKFLQNNIKLSINSSGLFEKSGQYIVKIQKRIQKILLVQNFQTDKKRLQQMKNIIKLMNYILAVKFLQFYQIKLSQKNKGEYTKKYEEILRKLQLGAFKLLSVSLRVHKQQKLDETLRYAYYIMWVKLHFVIYYIKCLQDQSNSELIQIVYRHIVNIKSEPSQSVTQQATVKDVLKVVQFNKEVSLLFHNQNNTKIEDDTFRQLFEILFIFNKMRSSIKKNEQIISKAAPWIKQFEFSFHVYDKNSINLAMMPLFPILKMKITNFPTYSDSSVEQLLSLINEIENYQFVLLQENKTSKFATSSKIQPRLQNLGQSCNSLYLFSNIFNYYREDYLDSLFQIQKLKFHKFLEKKQITRIQIINNLNNIIKQCDNQKLERLKKVIQTYKKYEFNSFVAMISMSIQNPYRYESEIIEMIKNTQKWFGDGMFPRIDNLTPQNMIKYKQNDLFIPVALFVVDRFQKIFYKQKESRPLKSFRRKYASSFNFQCLQFFKCQVAIFCGKDVKKNIMKMKQINVQKNIKVAIFIDFNMVTKDNYGKNRNYKDQTLQKYQQILQLMITQQILLTFYQHFCKTMFLQKFENYLEQVSKSFSIAKKCSEFNCLKKFGTAYSNEVSNIFQAITCEIFDEKMLKKLDQLRLNQRKKQKEIKQKSYFDSMSTNAQTKRIQKQKQIQQIGFGLELSNIIALIQNKQKIFNQSKQKQLQQQQIKGQQKQNKKQKQKQKEQIQMKQKQQKQQNILQKQHKQKIQNQIQRSKTKLIIVLRCKDDEYKTVIKSLKYRLQTMSISGTIHHNNNTLINSTMSIYKGQSQKIKPIQNNRKKEEFQIVFNDEDYEKKLNQEQKISKFGELIFKQYSANPNKIMIIATDQILKEQQIIKKVEQINNKSQKMSKKMQQLSQKTKQQMKKKVQYCQFEVKCIQLNKFKNDNLIPIACHGYITKKLVSPKGVKKQDEFLKQLERLMEIEDIKIIKQLLKKYN